MLSMPASSASPLAQKLIARVPILHNLSSQAPSVRDEELFLDDKTKLDLFESVLDSIPDSKQKPDLSLVSSSRGVEKAENKILPTVEVPGITYVEQEPNPEIPVEVEGFLQRVEDTADKLNQEIILADKNLVTQDQNHPTQPVIVLPISEADERAAKGKSPKFSIAWLVEWSRKIIKKYFGKVIYKD